MRLAGLVAAVLIAALPAQSAEKPGASRASLAAMEKRFDARISSIAKNDPFDLLGTTRGVYLAAYGVVFTAEVQLIITPTITPFRPSISKEEVANVHRRKLERVPVLKQAMQEMLVTSAVALDTLPPAEQIVVAVSLFYYSWEDKAGLPSQVLMQASKSVLLDYQLGKVNEEVLRASVRLQEF